MVKFTVLCWDILIVILGCTGLSESQLDGPMGAKKICNLIHLLLGLFIFYTKH